MRNGRYYHIVLAAAFVLALLPGCSMAEGVREVDRTLDYVNGATSYVSDAASWAESIPAMAEQAVTDPQARDELIRQLEAIETRIDQFNGLDAPAVAADIHARLTGYNEQLKEEIALYLEKLNLNEIDLQALREVPLVQTLEDIAQTIDALRSLGQ